MPKANAALLFRICAAAALTAGAFAAACSAPSDADHAGRAAQGIEGVHECPQIIVDCQAGETSTCVEENGCPACTCPLAAPDASTCATTVSIPVPASEPPPTPATCGLAGFDLRDCLQGLILAQQGDCPLTIQIQPNPAGGPYLLGPGGGLILFQKKNITIQGAPAPGDGGASPTQITFESYDDATSEPAPALQFFAHIIDSSNITISDLTLDGGGHYLHGFGVCPLGGDPQNPTRDITIQGISAQGFLNFFTIAGQSVGQKYLSGRSANPMLEKVFQFTGASSDPSNPSQYCGGAIQNLTFQNNDLSLLSVGFYAVPLSVREATGYTGLEAPFLLSDGSDAGIAGQRADWLSVVESTSGENSGWYVGNNAFTVAIDPNYLPPAANGLTNYTYASQMSGYFHSGLKVQGTSGLTIENNTLSVGSNNPDMFAAGAGFNIAFDNLNVAIRNNQLLFASNYVYRERALIVESGFLLHPYYGVGWLSYTQPTQPNAAPIPIITDAGAPLVGSTGGDVAYGVEGLAGPSLGVSVVGNTFANAGMAVDACCDNAVNGTYPIQAWADVTDFCRDLDANQSPGNPKQDGWVVEGNTFNVSNLASRSTILAGRPVPGSQPAFATAANATFLASTPTPPFPEVEYCRQTLSWVNQGNRVCGPATAGGTVTCIAPTD